MTASIEKLSSRHDRRDFSCGVEPLDRYFRERVGQDVRARFGVCFVAVDEHGAVAGYYTLTATSIGSGELPEDQRKRLPRYPAVPAYLLGRLAVDMRYRGRGLGMGLLVDALTRAVNAEIAAYCMVVDAKDEAAAGFYGHFGFTPFASRPGTLHLPLSVAARLVAEPAP